MQKYFTSISTDKKGYGLNQYNVYKLQSETRRILKKYNVHAKQRKAGNFFEKI